MTEDRGSKAIGRPTRLNGRSQFALVIFGGGISMAVTAMLLVALLIVRANFAHRTLPPAGATADNVSADNVHVDIDQITYRTELEEAGRRSSYSLNVHIATNAEGERLSRFHSGEEPLPNLQRVLPEGRGVPLMECSSLILAQRGWIRGAVPAVRGPARHLLHSETETEIYNVQKLNNFASAEVADSANGRKPFGHRHVWSRDGECLYVLSRSSSSPRRQWLRKIDTLTWQLEHEIELAEEFSDLALSGAGLILVGDPLFASPSVRDGTEAWLQLVPSNLRLQHYKRGVVLLDPETLELRRAWITPRVQEVAASPSSDVIYLRGPKNTLLVMNVKFGELLNCYTCRDFALGAATDARVEDLHFLHLRLSSDAATLITYGMNDWQDGEGGGVNRSGKLGPRSVNRFRVAGESVVWQQSKRMGRVHSQYPRVADVGVSDEYLCLPNRQFEIVPTGELYMSVGRFTMAPETAIAIGTSSKTLFACWPDWQTKQLVFRTLRGTTDTELILAEDIKPPKSSPGNRHSTYSNQERVHRNLWPLEISASPDGRGALVFTLDAVYWVEPKLTPDDHWVFESTPQQRGMAGFADAGKRDAQNRQARTPSQRRAEILTRCKASTVLLNVSSKGRWGSAFCISEQGFLLTNAHYVRGLQVGEKVMIVTNAGTVGQRRASAVLERVNPELGVALLKTEPNLDLVPLRFGPDDRLPHAAALTAIGYTQIPDRELALGRYPIARTRPGTATALRKSEGQLVTIQFDGLLQPGNSGGPVIDANGDVIGIVQSGAVELGLHFLLPVTQLKQLDWPELAAAWDLEAESDGPGGVIPTDLARQATALVVRPSGNGFGTAFCVDDRGFFATNAHVVEGVSRSELLTLVLHSGEDQQQVFKAKVVRESAASDLALLELVDKPEQLVALPLAERDALTEQTQVAALGFPYGNVLAVDGEEFPSVSTNLAKINTASAEVLGHEAFEFRTQLNPGNSGGPVIDGDGRVVGVVFATALGTRKSYAVPLEHLRALMYFPDLDFPAPIVSHSQRRQATRFQVRATPYLRSLGGLQLELSLQPRHGPVKTYAMEAASEPGVYEAKLSPIAVDVPDYVEARLEFPTGSIAGVVADREVNVGAMTYRLSTAPENAFLGGQMISGLEMLDFQIGQSVYPINCSQATRATITTIPDPELEYTLIARQDGREVARVSAKLVIRDLPTPRTREHFLLNRLKQSWAGGVLSPELPRLKIVARFEDGMISGYTPDPLVDLESLRKRSSYALGEVTTEQLSGKEKRYGNVAIIIGENQFNADLTQANQLVAEPTIDPAIGKFVVGARFTDLVAAEGGRSLVLHLPELGSLGVFDVPTRRMRHQYPIGQERVLFAAGAEKLLILYTDRNILQRWDLQSGRHEQTAEISVKGPVTGMVMGCGCSGPLVLYGKSSSDPVEPAVSLIDPQNLEPIALSSSLSSATAAISPPLIASLDGSVVGCRDHALLFEADDSEVIKLTSTLPSQGDKRPRQVYPAPSGRYLFHGSTTFTRSGEPVATQARFDRIFPAYNSEYCLAVNSSQLMTLCVVKNGTLLPRVEFSYASMRSFSDNPKHVLPLWKRYHLYPDANLLVFVSENQDTLLFKELPPF